MGWNFINYCMVDGHSQFKQILYIGPSQSVKIQQPSRQLLEGTSSNLKL